MTLGKLKISVLIAGILTLGGWTETAIACGNLVGSKKVAIQPQDQNYQRHPNYRSYKTFTDWCLNRDRLSLGAQETVHVLLAQAETSNCYQAGKKLDTVSQLNLRYDYRAAIDLSPLQSLLKLTDLSIRMSPVTDLSPLQTMTQLTRLRLEEVPVRDIRPLQTLSNLTELKLIGTLVTNLDALQSLRNLTALEVGGSRLRCPMYRNSIQVTDVNPLSSLTHLTYLNLSQNKIQNIAPLSSLTQLTHLDLRHNKIRDLVALKALTHLSVLKLGGNSIWGKTCPLQPASICQF